MTEAEQSTRTIIELREPPAPTAQHSHFISPPKWSLAPQKQQRAAKDVGVSCLGAVAGKWRVIFWTRQSESLASVLTTTEEPLLGSRTSAECLPCDTVFSSSSFSSSERHLSFAEKYGSCLEILHYGFNSTVRLHQDKKGRQLVAVKVYRHNIWGFLGLPISPKKRSFSSNTIAELHLHHPNIMPIVDLLFNKHAQLCLVTPYYGGGNLHELLMHKKSLPAGETDCLIAQLLRALAFIHAQNMAHRDVRLETVLLTQNGSVKLAGFSDEYVHRLWTRGARAIELHSESESPSSDEDELPDQHPSYPPLSLSHLINPCSSSRPRLRRANPANTPNRPTYSFPGIRLPYMAPEDFVSGLHSWYHETLHTIAEEEHAHVGKQGDSHPVDIWAVGVIYFTLMAGKLPWRSARRGPLDARYEEYLRCRPGNFKGDGDGYSPIEAFGQRRSKAVYGLLHPDPKERSTAQGLLESAWANGVVVCEAGEKGL
ncbi:kinase-like domain-containing protein [Aspergillus heterothallicus]